MKKRIFIAINLPDEIKRELLSYEKRWRNLRIKWTNFYKLHITIEFLGEVDKKNLDLILSACQTTASSLRPFNIKLDKIVLGPDAIQAKMIWTMIHVDANIMMLKKLLHKNLVNENFNIKDNPFIPHITLARARGNQLKGKQTNTILKNLRFEATSMDVIESQLRPNIEKYKLIENFEFKNNN